MRLFEIEMNLDEEQVFSSWIDEISYDGNGRVLLLLLSGRQYIVHDVPEEVFEEWLEAPSKGKFWHSDIRDYYIVMKA